MNACPWSPVVALLLVAAPVVGQQRQAAYARQRTEALAEAGQRHLRLGSWARDQGLVPQATAQFLRAVEVSEGRNPGAQTVLGAMRGLGDAFWTQQRKRPGKALLAEFDRRAAAIEAETRAEQLALAQLAAAAGMVLEARRDYRRVLELGGELEFDAKTGWRIDRKRIPEAYGEWLRDQVATDRDGKAHFEAAGAAAPRLPGLVVHEDPVLQVRTDLPGDAARQLHALGGALLPHLRERLDGAPTRRLTLTVFARHDDYAAYLAARGLQVHATAPGLTDYATFQSLVAASTPDGSRRTADELHALVLHELAHLYFFAVAPAVMPDWYAEGFAETFGGQGTFTWDGTVLTVGGRMATARIAAMRAALVPLRQLVDVRIAVLLAADRERALAFYAQCWALARYLRQPDCPWRERFAWFEAKCRGQSLGAPQPGQQATNPVPAAVEFLRLFGDQLDAVDAAFRTWLATL